MEEKSTAQIDHHFDIKAETFSQWAHKAVDWIVNYLENMNRYPVLSSVAPGDIRSKLPAMPPEQEESFEKIFNDFEKIIIPGITHWNHPRFFAYFSITGAYPGVIAEMLSAALNVNAMLWKTSPSATELEEVTLNWLRQMLGLPETFDAIINDTASVGSLCAMAAAREYAGLHIREKGMAGLPALTIYTSNQAHSSIEKGAIILGIGKDNVRKININDRFEMRTELLTAAIEKDIAAGKKPICIIGTIGTTSTTSIDPIERIADICEHYNLWFHIDAAYGGAAAILPEYRSIFSGWQRADSIIVNPHKWLFTPIDCSVLFCRKPEVLKAAFSLIPEYLRTREDDAVKNFMDYGVALGRRFRSLKLWMIIRALGTFKIQHVIREHIAFAGKLRKMIELHPNFELLAPTPFSTLVFRFAKSGLDQDRLNQLNQELLDAVNATGEVFLSHTVLNSKFTIRLAIGNIKTTWVDVERAWEILQQKADELNN